MKKRVWKIASILCCLATLLALVPEVAKADPGVEVAHISDEVFDYEGGFVEAKYTVSNPDYENQKATYEWYGGTTDVVEDMTREFAHNSDSKYFYPTCKLGKNYYYCKVTVAGMEVKSNVFSVTFTDELWDIQVLSQPKKKYYELDEYINFEGVKVQITWKQLVGEDKKKVYTGNSAIVQALDSP